MNKQSIRVKRIMGFIIFLLSISGCTSYGSRHVNIPSVDEFKVPAIGTLIPGKHEESISSTLSSEIGGILFVNQSGVEVKVAVSSTIATLPAGSNFLFILPPSTYQFYLYPAAAASWAYSDTVTASSIRYVYLPLGGVPGTNIK
jgi:hypothetical protein